MSDRKIKLDFGSASCASLYTLMILGKGMSVSQEYAGNILTDLLDTAKGNYFKNARITSVDNNNIELYACENGDHCLYVTGTVNDTQGAKNYRFKVFFDDGSEVLSYTAEELSFA